jgi:hypothetical protein
VRQLTDDQNAERIATLFDKETLEFIYADSEDPYGEYFRDISEEIGAKPMPPRELIMSKLL